MLTVRHIARRSVNDVVSESVELTNLGGVNIDRIPIQGVRKQESPQSDWLALFTIALFCKQALQSCAEIKHTIVIVCARNAGRDPVEGAQPASLQVIVRQ